MPRVPLGVLFGLLLLVLAVSLAASIFVLLDKASSDAISAAIDMVSVRTHDRIESGLQAFFRSAYPNVDALALLLQKNVVQLNQTNQTSTTFLRSLMWEMLVQNPQYYYLWCALYPGGESLGFSQHLGGATPYYDHWINAPGDEHLQLYPVDPAGNINFSDPTLYILNATAEGLLDKAQDIPPGGTRLRSWTAANHVWDPDAQRSTFLINLQSFFYEVKTGKVRGATEADMSMDFLSGYLGSMTYTPSEEYFLVEGTDWETRSREGYDDLYVLGVSDPVKYPLLLGEGEDQVPRTFRNFTEGMHPDVPRMVDKAVAQQWGSWVALMTALGAEQQGKVFFSKGSIDGESYHIAWSLFRELNLRFVLCSTVKESEYTDRLQEGIELATVIAISISVVVLVVCEFLMWFLLRPLRDLVQAMAAGASMNFENNLDELPHRSFLYEISMLQRSFNVMASMMMEYKSFLPRNLFDDDVAEDIQSSAGSRASSSECSSISTALEAAAMSTLRTRMWLDHGKVALLTVSIRSFSQMKLRRVVELYSALLGAVLSAVHPHGSVHRASGDTIECSWGTLNIVPTPAFKAVRAALSIHVEGLRCVGMGVYLGRCCFGNLGTADVRSFTVFSPGATVASSLAMLAAGSAKAPVLVHQTVQSLIADHYTCTPVGLVDASPFYAIFGADEDTLEWMYVDTDDHRAVDDSEANHNFLKWVSGAVEELDSVSVAEITRRWGSRSDSFSKSVMEAIDSRDPKLLRISTLPTIGATTVETRMAW